MNTIRVSSLLLASVIALTVLSAEASAQFTTALVPPPEPPRVDTVARRDSARKAAQELQARMTSIKEWVDSAASALAAQPAEVPPVASDTARMPQLPDSLRGRPVPPDTSRQRPRRPPR